jgi:hypothetical protein
VSAGARSRLLPVAVGACLTLAACPQLLSDDFRIGDPDASLGEPDHRDAGPRPPPDRHALDASAPRIDAPMLATLRAALVHRYDMNGTGTMATDLLGGPNAFIWNASLDARGFVSLAGNDGYVSVPNGVLSSSNDKTLEAWLTWRGGAAWQRVFDFGSSDAGELNQGTAVSSFYLTASSEDGRMLVSYERLGILAVKLSGTRALPIGSLAHVAVVVDSKRDELLLYLNGSLNAKTTLTERLADIDDVNNWLGRSQFSRDPSLNADVAEFSIYDQALDAAQLAASYALGVDSSLVSAP